eukprot:scaffold29664_cov51-Attheya_sp.AAC.1
MTPGPVFLQFFTESDPCLITVLEQLGQININTTTNNQQCGHCSVADTPLHFEQLFNSFRFQNNVKPAIVGVCVRT